MAYSVICHGILLMIAYGTTFWRSTDGITYTQVIGVFDIAPPDLSRSVVDCTEPESEFSQCKPGQKKAGEVNVKLDAESPHAALMIDDYNSDSIVHYRIDYGENFRVNFSGYVISIKEDHSKGSKLYRNVSISISGKPSFLTMRG